MKITIFILSGTFLSYVTYFAITGESSLFNSLWKQEYAKSQENEFLKLKVVELSNQILKIKAEQGSPIQKMRPSSHVDRSPATKIFPKKHSKNSGKNSVDQEIYEWSDVDLKKIAYAKYAQQDYIGASEHFDVLIEKYPKSHLVTDEVYYFAGFSFFRKGGLEDFEKSKTYFEHIIKNYPKSTYRLQSKIWVGLAHLSLGNEDQFIHVVQEFKENYRNTNEWKMLSQYYGKVAQKYQF